MKIDKTPQIQIVTEAVFITKKARIRIDTKTTTKTRTMAAAEGSTSTDRRARPVRVTGSTTLTFTTDLQYF